LGFPLCALPAEFATGTPAAVLIRGGLFKGKLVSCVLRVTVAGLPSAGRLGVVPALGVEPVSAAGVVEVPGLVAVMLAELVLVVPEAPGATVVVIDTPSR